MCLVYPYILCILRSHCDINSGLKAKYPWKNSLAIIQYINEPHWLPKGNKKCSNDIWGCEVI